MTNPTPKKSLKNLIVTTRKEVVLSDGSKVMLAIKAKTVAEERAFLKEHPEMANPTPEMAMEIGIQRAVEQIESWEFEEEINRENFELLPVDDMKKIIDALN